MRRNSLLLAVAGVLAPALCADTGGALQISYTIQTVAGSNSAGDGGPATAASLSDAEGVAVDPSGNVFIADANDHRVRKVAPDGTISTVAGDGVPGFGGDGGPAPSARLNMPYGITVDPAGNLYIADLGNNRVRKVTADGSITTVPGTDSLVAPRNVAVDSTGSLYISEFGGHRIWRVGTDGAVNCIAGTGTPGFSGDGGPATGAQLAYPAGLAVDGAGNLYIADSSNHRVRKVTGGAITTVLGTGDPGASPNQLNTPTGVAVDPSGDLYVADSGNQRIQQLTPSGTVNTLAGAARDLVIDSAGDLFIASGPYAMELTPSLVLQTIAGDGSYDFRGDGGSATSARLNGPVAIALAPSGDAYIADQKNCRIRAVNSAGVISTVLGDGTSGSGSGQLSFPGGVALDSSGNLYVSDQNNDRIQELTAAGSAITVAGTGVPGFNGDDLLAAATQLFTPEAMAIASDQTLYFIDAGNGRVRKLNSAGIVTTLALMQARGVAVDASNNVYMSDGALHRIIRIDTQGRMLVIAGSGTPGFGGDGGPSNSAKLNSPSGIATDVQGNLYVADTGNNLVRMIGTDGIIRTIAGTGAADFDGDGGPALSAKLNAPTGLSVDESGNIWVADTGNNRIRVLSPAPVASQQVEPPGIVNAASFLPGPVAPGEIVSIFGTGIGPTEGASATLDSSGAVTTGLGGTTALFGGIAAPLFYSQDSQVNAQVPYEMTPGDTVEVEILYNGQSRGKATVSIAPAAPGIFTVSAGTGLALAINQDGIFNSPADPAAEGSVVTLYATGEGLLQPPLADGQPSAAPFPAPALPVTLSIGGRPAEILFAGEAPGFAGLLQINARVPTGLSSSGSVPVLLRMGTAPSQSGATIAVR